MPLLSVCQRWRRLALPIVHCGVSIELERAGIKSNLGLVVSAGCLHARAPDAHGGGAAADDHKEKEEEEEEDNNIIKRAAAALFAIVPGVVQAQLRAAAIVWHRGRDDGYRHPRVDPANLVSLKLDRWPAVHSWTPFGADSASAEIVFPSLRDLDVWYTRDSEAGDLFGGGGGVQHWDGRPWRLHFPKLAVLRLSCAHDDACPLLEYAVLPLRMDWIRIETTGAVLQRVARMALPVASRRLEICISRDAGGGPTGLAAANRILERAHESKEAALRVYDPLLPVLPESITCTRLTELEIAHVTSADAMLGLIRKLPGLARLVVSRAELEGIQDRIAVPGPGDGSLAEPFDTGLRALCISSYDDDSEDRYNRDAIVALAKYLLLKTPTLVAFESADTPRAPIEEFVREYSAQYPHLAGVEFELDAESDG
ncbi:hypothetical protein H4R18_004992 [Coemansia javaensis]|uniref:Uncharacterized protein n=1 Tax=Coemansia javaensis TaxID=2761396 RepID=A0A9W8H7T4_9FUNG|nr:hypothetical protein H4R18_004992 [Coemansia javaensis]